MYTYFEGVSALTICDNLCSGVTHPDRYEAEVNAAYRDFVLHLGTCMLPTRVRKLRGKGLMKRLTKIAIIQIDDFGLAPFSDREKQDPLKTLEERYGTGTAVVTSQLPVSDGHEFLDGGCIADAILVRLVHHAHRIELRSPESMREAYPRGIHGGQSGE